MTLNKKHCLLFLAMVIILLGMTIVSATEVQDLNHTQEKTDNNKLSTPDNYDVDKVVQSSASTTSKDAKVENKETKIQTNTDNTDNTKQITKNTEKNTKKSSQTITNYADLSDLLETTTEGDLIVELQGNDDDFISTGRITVSTNLKNLIINGNYITIDGKGSEKFLEIESMNLTLNNIIVKNCYDDWDGGSVIYARSSNITLNNSIFENNNEDDYSYGGVISIQKFPDYASLTTNNCTFKNNYAGFAGGAIYSDGADIFINNSTFINNVVSDDSGGAIYSSGADIFINDSHFVENTASEYGGAIRGDQNINLTRCNFTKNTAGYHGGAIYYLLNLTVDDCNFTENHADNDGGAIADAEARDYPDLVGYTTINDSRFLGNTADRDGGAFLDRAKKDEDSTVGNHILIQNSEFSENEATRNGGVIFIRTDLETSIENTNFTSNNAAEAGVIYVNGTGQLTITSSNITSNIAGHGGVIYQNAQNDIKLLNSNFTNNNASNDGGVIYSKSNNIIIISDSVLDDNYANGRGGGIYQEDYSNLTIINSNFTSNNATYVPPAGYGHQAIDYGGAIWQGENSNLTIIDSNFQNNVAFSGGGAIYQVSNCMINVSNSNFTGNNITDKSSGKNGGAICQESNNVLIINNSLFKDNTASSGGAIYSSGADIFINDSHFVENTASAYGGAILQNKGNQIINNSNFTNNQANRGGAIGQEDNAINLNITIHNSNFTNNIAKYIGGAIYQNDYNNLTIINSNFTDNQANTLDGGAIYQSSYNNLTINTTNFTNNQAKGSSGGAVYQYQYSNLKVDQSIFDNNTVQTNGGAIYQYDSGNLTILNSNIMQNKAKRGGAIATNNYNNITVYNTNFTNNQATGSSNKGGAIYANENYNFQLKGCNFTKNSGSTGGAIFSEGNLTIDECNFTENTASNGAVIYYDDGTSYTNNIEINNSHFTKNRATATAAVLLINNVNAKYLINNSYFDENVAGTSSLFYIKSNQNSIINNSNFTKNNATDSGIYKTGSGELIISYSNFTSNYASTRAPTVNIMSSSKVTLENNLFDSNWVANKNNYVLNLQKDMTIVGNTFINNTNNARDMLFNILVDEVHDNVYINNYLNDTMAVVDRTVSEDLTEDINIDLRDVYNDTIRNGTLIVFISGIEGEYDSIDVNDGIAPLNILYADLPANENTVTLKYITLDKHYQNITQTFKLNKAMTNSNITVSANETVKVGQTVRINGTLTMDDDEKTPVDEATIYLYINDTLKDTTQTNPNGEYEFNYITPNIGLQQVTVNFTGKDNIQFSSNKTSFTVTPRNTNMTIENNETLFAGQNITVSGVLYDELGEEVSNTEVIIWIRGEGYGQFMRADVGADGQYSNSIPVAYHGTFVIEVQYVSHNSNYTSSTNTSSVTVNARKTNMTIVNNETILVGQNVTIKGILLDQIGEAVPNTLLNITIGEHKIEDVPVEEDGTYSVEYQLNTVGPYDITVTYINETITYIGSINTSSVTVNPRSTNMTIVNNATIFAGQNVSISCVLRDELGEIIPNTLVNISIGSYPKKEVEVNSEGEYSLNYIIDEAGTFEIKLEYNSQNSNYTSSINTSSVLVNARSTNMTIENEPTIISNTTLTITGVLTDELGENISNTFVNIKIGTHEINDVEVDANGVYTTSYIIESADEYIITVEYTNETTKYMSSTNTSKVIVTKRPTITNLTVSDNKFGNVTIKVNVTDLYADKLVNTGNFTVYDSFGNKLNITKIEISGNNIIVNLSSNISKVGPIQISVGYDSNDIYAGSYAINETSTNPSTTYLFEINVEKVDSKITVKVNTTNTTIGENVTITGTLTDAMGNNISDAEVIVNVDGQDIPVKTDNDGLYTLEYTSVKTGNITVVACFDGGDNYNPSSAETSFNVTLIPTITSADFVNSTIGNVVVNVNVTNASGIPVSRGHVRVYDNATGLLVGEGDLTNGGANVTLSVSAPGHIGVNVTFDANDVYESSNAVGNVNPQTNITETDVVQLSSTISINVEPSSLTVGENVYISGNVFDANAKVISEGKVNITINGSNFTVDVKDGYYNLTYVTGNVGIFTVNATYLGNTNVSSSISEDKSFTVNKVIVTPIIVIDLDKDNVTIGETVKINGTALDNVGEPLPDGTVISINIAGLDETATISGDEGKFEYTYTTTSAGVFTANATKDDITSNNIEFTVNKKSTNTTVQIMNNTVGNVTIDVVITNESGSPITSGNFNVTVAGKTTTYSIKGSNTTVKIEDINVTDNIQVSVTYLGTEIYAPSNAINKDTSEELTNITTVKQETSLTISVQPTSTYIGENVTINGTLYDAMGNTIPDAWIIISLNNSEYPTKTSADGKYSISNVTIANGTIEVIANYEGNAAYNACTNKTQFAVSKINTTTLVSIENSTIGNVSINVIIIDKDNNTVTSGQIRVTTPEETVTVNVTGDVTNISLKFTSNGTKKVTVEYLEDNVYLNSTGLDKISYDIDPSHAFIFNNITVIKINTTLSVNTITPVKAGYSTVIDGVLVDEYGRPILDATIVVYINQTEMGTATTSSDGSYTFEFNDTIVGTHNVTCSYDGNDTYIGSEATTTLEVEKIHTKISINPIEDVPLGKEVTITGKLTDEFQEPIKESEVNVTFDGNTQTVKTDNEGNYIATFPTNNIGEKPITVEYGGNNKYTNTTNESKTNVNPKTGKITVEMPENATVNKPTDITGSVTDEEGNPLPNVPVNVTVNGKTYPTTTDENGTFKVPVDNVAVGLNNVTVTAGDENTTAQPVGDKFLGNKQDTNLSIDPVDDVEFGDEVTITGKLADDEGNPIADAPISVIVDNQIVKVTTDDEGNYEANVTTNKLGELPVTVEFKGNEIYNPTETESTINVEPKTATIELVVPEEATVNKPAEIYGRVTDKEGNILFDVPVVVTVNGEDYPAVTDENGMYTIEADNVVVGDNNVTVRVVDETISAQPVNDSFTADKQDTELSLEYIEPTTVGDNANIEGQLVDDEGNPIADAPITVTVDGKDYPTTTDENGNYEVLVPVDKVGELPVNVAFAGDDTYNPVNVYSSVLVEPVDAVVNVEVPENATVNKPVNITGSVTDEEGNPLPNVPVNVTVNGKTYPTTTDENGTFKVPVDNIVPGTNNVTVTAGNENTTAQPVNTEFTATINTNITIDPIDDTLVGENVTISGTLTDEEQNPVKDALVTVTVNGFSKTVKTDEQGKYNVPWPTNNVGKEQVSVEYLGNDKYNSVKADETFNVIKNEGTNSITVPSDAKVGEPASIKGKLTDKNGKAVPNMPVNVTVNNKTYKTITDADGNYEIEANNVIEGQNNVTVTSGNDKIDVEDVSSTFDARRKDASLTVNPIAKAKVGDNVTITGKLVDEQNNPITNAPVKVTVNNKTYTVVTDEEGNYEITVPNVVEGLNKVNVTYINDEYNTQSTNTTFEASKAKTIVTVPSITGIVGEDITLTAYVTDEDGNPVTGGNLVFKLNGRTLREDGRFDTDDANPIKFKVQNGIVTYTMKADLYLRAGKNITASYSGSYKYEAAKGNVAEANIKKRTAQVTVSVTPNPAKQNTDIVFTATLDDITRNATNATCLTTDGRVLFKLNGVSLKDAEGNNNWVPATHSAVNYVYHVPTGTGGVDENGLKDYTVEAVYDNPAFYPDTRNTSVYHVDRSIVNINFIKTSVSNDVLSVKATFTDYENNYLVGDNKICVKINGKTYQENGKTKYFTVRDGKVDLTGIKLGSGTKVKSVMLVTGDRQAYLSARATTTDITTN